MKGGQLVDWKNRRMKKRGEAMGAFNEMEKEIVRKTEIRFTP